MIYSVRVGGRVISFAKARRQRILDGRNLYNNYKCPILACKSNSVNVCGM